MIHHLNNSWGDYTCKVKSQSVLSEPLQNGHLYKSRKSFPLMSLIIAKLTLTSGGRGHLLRGPNELFSIVFTSIKRSL